MVTGPCMMSYVIFEKVDAPLYKGKQDDFRGKEKWSDSLENIDFI